MIKKVVLATLYRFGGTITCVDENSNKCLESIMDMYEDMYRKENDDADPRKVFEHSETMSDYDYAIEDIEWNEYELGEAVFM